ncbi:hypothetical protein CRYUN_Cryun26dG0058400 [Craigia yunnanensis]
MDKRAMGAPPEASDTPLQINSLGIGSSSFPWMDPVSKSFSMASSVPALKLVSGFFSISGSSKQFYRVVHEPESWENDQTDHVNSKFQGSRALCIAMVRNSAQVVVGACNGTIHMFSVDHIFRGLGNVVEKYSGIADIKKKDVKEGAILSLLNYPVDNRGSQMFMYSTQSCGIHLWDTRSSSNAWTLKAIPEEGYISCLYSLVCPVEKMCLFIPPSSVSVSTTSRPLIYVAAGCNEVSLWNAENGSCHQVFRAANYDSDAEMSDLPWALARPSTKTSSKSDLRRNANPKYRVDEINEPPPHLPGLTEVALSVAQILRESEMMISTKHDQETKRRPLTTKLTAKAVLAAAATDSAGCHHDSILSLASVKLNQRLLLSSSRDGAIKVWK